MLESEDLAGCDYAVAVAGVCVGAGGWARDKEVWAAERGLSASAICLLGIELDGSKRLEDLGVFRYNSGLPI